MALKVTESMSMGSRGFNQRRPDEGWRPLTLPVILSPSIWALVNNHQWVGPRDRSLALRKINICSLLKAASHLTQTRKFHPRLSMMSQYQSERRRGRTKLREGCTEHKQI